MGWVFQSLVVIAPSGSQPNAAAVESLVESGSAGWWESQRNVDGLEEMAGSQPSVEAVGSLAESDSGPQPSVAAVGPWSRAVLRVCGMLQRNGDGIKGMAERGNGKELGAPWVMSPSPKAMGLDSEEEPPVSLS